MILCIIQARMGSSRFYGKVLKEVCGKTILEHIIARLKNSKKIDEIAVATTTAEVDNAIFDLCISKGISVFRGSEPDVLDRFYQAAKQFEAKAGDEIVRITGDCPFADPVIADKVIELFERENTDYGANVNPPTYPDGLDVEVVKYSVLEKIWEEAKLMSDREHVTWYIRRQPEVFSISNLVSETDYSDMRWTVDEPEDFEVIKAIYENLYKEDKIFLMQDILDFTAKYSEITEKNKKFRRDEGLEKSLQNDKVME